MADIREGNARPVPIHYKNISNNWTRQVACSFSLVGSCKKKKKKKKKGFWLEHNFWERKMGFSTGENLVIFRSRLPSHKYQVCSPGNKSAWQDWRYWCQRRREGLRSIEANGHSETRQTRIYWRSLRPVPVGPDKIRPAVKISRI